MLIPIHVPSSGANTFLDDWSDLGLTTDLKVCLDAGASASYSGSGQDWVDLSGNIGGDEFHRGATAGSEASDPTFNGSAGALSSAEYFSMDGGDYFRYGAANETWMENYHKDNAILGIGMWVYWPGGTGQQALCGTAGGSSSNVGFEFYLDSGDPTFTVYAGGTAPIGVSHGTSLKSGAWNFVAVSLDESVGTNGGRFWLGNADGTGSSSFTSTYTSPSSSAATYTAEVMTRANAASPMPNNTRVGGVFFFEGGTALTATNWSNFYDATKARWGL